MSCCSTIRLDQHEHRNIRWRKHFLTISVRALTKYKLTLQNTQTSCLIVSQMQRMRALIMIFLIRTVFILPITLTQEIFVMLPKDIKLKNAQLWKARKQWTGLTVTYPPRKDLIYTNGDRFIIFTIFVPTIPSQILVLQIWHIKCKGGDINIDVNYVTGLGLQFGLEFGLAKLSKLSIP